MELFTIDRYTEEGVKPDEKDEEDAILQKLIRKVEKRKRKRGKKQDSALIPIELHEEINTSAQNENNELNAMQPEYVSQHLPSKEDDVDNPLGVDMETEENEIYQILGEDVSNVKKPIVNMILPPWLAQPEIVSKSLTDNGDQVDDVAYLSDNIRGALKKMNINKLFPVQTAVIPNILQAHRLPPPLRPRDICVSVPTGSGKTLAFAIPIVQLLSEQCVNRKVRALVVLPVSELALQVFKVFKQLCEYTNLTVCLLSTQSTLHAEQERLIELYKEKHYSKVDIIITTPGRLVDHLHSTKGLCLKSLQFLVIDEADRIIDATFQNWMNQLDNHVRSENPNHLGFFQAAPLCYYALEMNYGMQPQKMLFSATLTHDPEKLQTVGLFQPQLFTSAPPNMDELNEQCIETNNVKTDASEDMIGRYTTPAELTEKYCLTESRLKPLTLFALISVNQWSKFLCFTNSVESSGRLSFVLKQLLKEHNVKIAELSASLKAVERSNILSLFSRGKINGLICSDALARGIDIPDVDIIVSYDPPRHIKTYIHRVGRTARAGRLGTAITLLNEKEFETFNHMLKEVGRALPEELSASTDIEEAHAGQYKTALAALRNKITNDKRLRLLQRENVKEQALLHKNVEQITLTEKLQLQASVQVREKVNNETSKMLSSKKKPSTKFKPRKQKEITKSQ